MMNVHRDRDCVSRSIGFVVADMICFGTHANAGTSNPGKIDLVCVHYVWHMQQYAQPMVCANCCVLASSKHHNLTAAEVVPKHYVNNQVPTVIPK